MPRVRQKVGKGLCRFSLCFGGEPAAGHEVLQAAGAKSETVLRDDLGCQFRQVFFKPAEVIEMLAVSGPFALSGGPGARFNARHASFEGAHVAIPAIGNELVLLAWGNCAETFPAYVLFASGGRGFRLKIGHSDSSPAVHRQAYR